MSRIIAPEKLKNKTWFASFDVGKKNFAFCIEEFDHDFIKSNIPKLKLSDRYNENYTPSDTFNTHLNTLFSHGKILVLKNTDLTKNLEDPKKYYDSDLCHEMTELLDQYIDYWNNCSGFIIEQQMSFRGKINSMALKLGQHCFSYFAVNYKRFKTIIEFPSYHKTNVLGAERSLSYTKKGKKKWKTLGDKERKKWAVEKAKEILELRNDDTFLPLYQPQKRKKGVRKMKLDDISDVIIQLQAYKYLNIVAQEL